MEAREFRGACEQAMLKIAIRCRFGSLETEPGIPRVRNAQSFRDSSIGCLQHSVCVTWPYRMGGALFAALRPHIRLVLLHVINRTGVCCLRLRAREVSFASELHSFENQL